jgi:hypothetical protein
MNYIKPLFGGFTEADTSITANSDSEVSVDFSFFTSDKAKLPADGVSEEGSTSKKKKKQLKLAVNGEVMPEAQLTNPIPGAGVAEVDYARSYSETNALIRGAIVQADELSAEIEHDLQSAIKAGGTPIQQFLEQRRAQEKAQFETLIQTPLGERAYRQQYGIPDNIPLSNYFGDVNGYNIPDSTFFGFYNQNSNTLDWTDRPSISVVSEDQAFLLEDDEYRYQDHFNF